MYNPLMLNHQVLSLYDNQIRIQAEIPGMTKEAWPHLVRFTRPAPGRSLISYSRLDETNADAVIQEQIAHYREINCPLGWTVYAYDTPSDLGERLVAHGFERDMDPDDPGPVMMLDLQSPPPVLLQPVTADVRPITRREQLGEVISVMEQVYGGNFAWITQRLGDHLEVPDYLSIYMAYAEGVPACAGWIYFHANSQFADLNGGSTVAQFRHQGLYTAVLATRVQEAIRRGDRYLMIEASPMSRPIVARHGFQLLTYAVDYKWPPDEGI